MKFFVPRVKDDEQRDRVYSGIRLFVADQFKTELSDRKIYSLRYVHKGKKHNAEIGKVLEDVGELVFAILFEPRRNLYHVCTTNRGVIRGMSVLVGEDEVEDTTDFDGDE